MIESRTIGGAVRQRAKGEAGAFTLMPNPTPEIRTWATERLLWALRTYAYLTKTQLSDALQAYVDRVNARPTVRAALAAEGAKSG